LSGPTSAAIKHGVYRYPSESKAQKHCPQDEVVYGSRNGHRYYEKGDPRYGHIKNAVFVCRHEADRGGWHEQQPH
jgi:citrate synthase